MNQAYMTKITRLLEFCVWVRTVIDCDIKKHLLLRNRLPLVVLGYGQ